jgi:hypothetical protein
MTIDATLVALIMYCCGFMTGLAIAEIAVKMSQRWGWLS